jgi:hypothetical protein
MRTMEEFEGIVSLEDEVVEFLPAWRMDLGEVRIGVVGIGELSSSSSEDDTMEATPIRPQSEGAANGRAEGQSNVGKPLGTHADDHMCCPAVEFDEDVVSLEAEAVEFLPAWLESLGGVRVGPGGMEESSPEDDSPEFTPLQPQPEGTVPGGMDSPAEGWRSVERRWVPRPATSTPAR